MIEVESLTRRYDDFVAVDDVSFAIAPGEVVGLLGHNGAGKTTVMKMLTGFLEPSSGYAKIGGCVVEEQPQAVQAQIGYLPENLPLYPEMLVVDYLAYVARLRGLEPATAVRRAIAATQLEDKALDPIGTLSRGYKQRVGVAQAIVHEPEYLILDEPTNGLDPSQTQQMRSLITGLSQRATVILSTHIMQEVDAVCDRALIMRGGRLVFNESLASLEQTAALSLTVADTAQVAALLEAQPNVAAITAVAPGQYDVQLKADPNGLTVNAATGALVSTLVGQGVEIFAISPKRRDLEQVFREVNEAEPLGANHAA